MADRKPTAAQIETLKLIREGRVVERNHGHSAWRIDGAVPQVVGRCVSLGWAKWLQQPDGTRTCELTDAGRKVLNASVHP